MTVEGLITQLERGGLAGLAERTRGAGPGVAVPTRGVVPVANRAYAIRIPDTVGQLVITVDLRAGKITCHVDLDAPREGRPTTRGN